MMAFLDRVVMGCRETQHQPGVPRAAVLLLCYCCAHLVASAVGSPSKLRNKSSGPGFESRAMSANRAAQSRRLLSTSGGPPLRHRRFLTTGGLKGWQYGVLVVSCVGSMLAGASVVHRVFAPDLSLPEVSINRDTSEQEQNDGEQRSH